jgi:hypothetical protein
LNALAERFVESIRRECLARIVPLGEGHLRAAVRSFAEHHILKNETTNHELGADHFEWRDKAQVTRRLIRRLEELGLSVEVKSAA